MLLNSCAAGQPGTILVPLLGLLVQRLVMDDVPRGMVERSGSALLPLIIAEPAAFQRLGEHSAVEHAVQGTTP